MKSIHKYERIEGYTEVQLEIDPDQQYVPSIFITANGLTITLMPEQARWVAKLILTEVKEKNED